MRITIRIISWTGLSLSHISTSRFSRNSGFPPEPRELPARSTFRSRSGLFVNIPFAKWSTPGTER